MIWIPPSARDDQVVYTCMVCGQEGVDEAHVHACSRTGDTEGLRQQASLAAKVPEVFDHGPERSDVELIDWVEENREAIIEGRKRVN